MDPDDYRAQVEAEIAAAQAPTEGTSVDWSADAATRAAQILALGDAAANDDALFSELIQHLNDAGEDPSVRDAILTTLKNQAFRRGGFAQRSAAWTGALRQLTSDANQSLRLNALSTLANAKDGQAQDLLLAALRDPANGVVAPAIALQLLSGDLHSEVIPLARNLLQGSPDADTRYEALRALGTDAGSVQMFVDLLRNPAESSEVRRLALSALSSLAPDALVANAQDIVLRGDNDTDLVAASLSALAASNQAISPEVGERATTLASAGNEALQLAAGQIQARLQS